MFKKFIFKIIQVTKFVDKNGLFILVSNAFVLSIAKCIASIFKLNEVN